MYENLLAMFQHRQTENLKKKRKIEVEIKKILFNHELVDMINME
jgi:Cu/Ag efflux protein CusF